MCDVNTIWLICPCMYAGLPLLGTRLVGVLVFLHMLGMFHVLIIGYVVLSWIDIWCSFMNYYFGIYLWQGARCTISVLIYGYACLCFVSLLFSIPCGTMSTVGAVCASCWAVLPPCGFMQAQLRLPLRWLWDCGSFGYSSVFMSLALWPMEAGFRLVLSYRFFSL